jgi:Divergent InlB B-repeat domain
MRNTRLLATSLLVAASVLSAQSIALASARAVTPTATLTPSLSSVKLNVSDVVGGTPVVGTVTLTSKAATGGLSVALSSDDTVAATVAASVTVPAGATSATFPVTTLPVSNSQSALIIGSAGAVTTYAIITVHTQSAFSNGSIAIIPGGNGSGTITSQPAGINCTIGASVGGACSASYPVGTVVRLTATAAPGSKFQGWRGLPGCGDASKITVARTTIYCQPGFSLK